MDIQTVALWDSWVNIKSYDFDPTAIPEFAHLFNPTITSLRRMHRHATSFCLTTTDGAWRPWTRTTTCLIFFNDILSLNCTGTFRDKDSYQTKRRKICRSVLLPTQLCNTHSHTDSESDWCTVLHLIMAVLVYHALNMSRAGRQLKKTWPDEQCLHDSRKVCRDQGGPNLYSRMYT